MRTVGNTIPDAVDAVLPTEGLGVVQRLTDTSPVVVILGWRRSLALDHECRDAGPDITPACGRLLGPEHDLDDDDVGQLLSLVGYAALLVDEESLVLVEVPLQGAAPKVADMLLERVVAGLVQFGLEFLEAVHWLEGVLCRIDGASVADPLGLAAILRRVLSCHRDSSCRAVGSEADADEDYWVDRWIEEGLRGKTRRIL